MPCATSCLSYRVQPVESVHRESRIMNGHATNPRRGTVYTMIDARQGHTMTVELIE